MFDIHANRATLPPGFQFWGRTIVADKDYSAERLVIRYEIEGGFEVNALTESLSGLAREFKALEAERGGDGSARLIITEMKSGSLEYELAYTGLLAYGLLGGGGTSVSTILTLFDLGERIKGIIKYVSGEEEERPKELAPSTARNMEAFLKPLAGRRGAALKLKKVRYAERSPDGRQVVAEMEFTETEIATGMVNLIREADSQPLLEAVTGAPHKVAREKLFYWFQLNRGEAKERGQTGDRGFIKEISDKPLRVYFPSDRSSLKDKMIHSHENPLKKGFIVTADVQYAGEKPALYTIMDVHEVMDLDEA